MGKQQTATQVAPAQTTTAAPEVAATAPVEEPMVAAVAMVQVPGRLGHSIVELAIPASLIADLEVKRHPPDIRMMVIDRLSQWAQRQP